MKNKQIYVLKLLDTFITPIRTCRGVLLVWIIVGQGPIALAVGAGGGLDIFFSHLPFLSSFSLSMGDGPIQTEILSQRAVKPKTTNQPTY